MYHDLRELRLKSFKWKNRKDSHVKLKYNGKKKN